MKKTFLFLFIISAFIMSSCDVGSAEKMADEFHQHLKAGEYDYIADNMLDEESLVITPRAEWISLFSGMREFYGPILEISKDMGFESSYNDGITTVKFDYTITFEKLKIYERIYFVDRGQGYKFSGILYNEDFSALERQSENF